MRWRLSILPAFLVMAVFAGAPPAMADPLPYIDWRDLVESAGDGDHVVGEEMCARPEWPGAIAAF